MKYVNKQSLIERFGFDTIVSLTDADDVGQINDDALNRAITDAESVVDSYLSQAGYVADDNVVSTPIPLHTSNIVRYELMSDLATDEVDKRYRAAIEWLKDVAADRASVAVSSEDKGFAEGARTGFGESKFDWSGY